MSPYNYKISDFADMNFVFETYSGKINMVLYVGLKPANPVRIA